MTLKQFFSSPGRVLITDRLSNINRLIRRWSLHDGMDFADCRVIPVVSAAKELVTAYAAVYEPGKCYRFVSYAMCTMIMQVIVKSEKLISVPEESKCTGTAEEILRSLNRIRMNEPTREFTDGTELKLSEMRRLLKLYEDRLSSKDELDYPMLLQKAAGYLDEIMKKEAPAKVLTTLLPWAGAGIGITEGMELSSAELAFLDKLEQASGKSFERDLALNSGSEPVYHFFESYGIAGEVRYAADMIRTQRMPYGDVLILYTSDAYENILRGELEAAGIPYAFSGGYHASSEDYITFFRDLITFVNEDYSYQALEKVIGNPVFCLKGVKKSFRAILQEGIGWGKKRYEDFFERAKEEPDPDPGAEEWQITEAENRKAFIRFLEEALAVFDEHQSCEQIFRGMIRLANTYTWQADRCRIMLTERLREQARAFSVIGSGESFFDRLTYISDYLKELRLSESDSPEAVSIRPYGERLISDRSRLFVLGLSNENISGTGAESPVFSDEELKRYAGGSPDLAAFRNVRKRARFERTLKAFEGNDIYVGFSDFDTVNLLENSRSLLCEDLMRKVGCTEDQIEKTGYSLIEGGTILSGQDFYAAYETSEEQPGSGQKHSFTPMYFSASSLQTLLYCPLQFYYRKVENLPQVEYTERTPDRWLQANQKGNLFHRTMEDYVNASLIEEEKKETDLALLERVFEENAALALREQPCPSQHIMEDEKAECFEAILRYAGNLHDELNASVSGKKVIGCEVRFSDHPYSGGAEYPDEESGTAVDLRYDIRFGGSADRVDGYVENGILNLEIIDYKTGSMDRKISEIEEGMQIQHYVYALCIKKWAEDHVDMLEKRFGEKIREIKIASMRYEFPFEEVEEGAEKIDVSETVTSDDLTLPDDVNAILELTVGNLQHGNIADCRRFMDEYLSEIIRQEKEADKDADHCRYCDYTNVCRRKLS